MQHDPAAPTLLGPEMVKGVNPAVYRLQIKGDVGMKASTRATLKQFKILRIIKTTLDRARLAVLRIPNGIGNTRKCYICGKSFFYFTKYRGGMKQVSAALKLLDVVGSNPDVFGCMYCGCHDRERHLFMYFDKLDVWVKMHQKRILHFAPEKHLSQKIENQLPFEYIKADLFPKSQDIKKLDASEIPLENDSVDVVIANHILEHIPNYRRVLAEFFRVLKPGGFAIVQTPYSKRLKYNFDDEGINTDDMRLFFHGQEDHVRTFSEQQFMKDLENVGFKLQIKKHADYFDINTTYYYGVPGKEDLIMVSK